MVAIGILTGVVSMDAGTPAQTPQPRTQVCAHRGDVRVAPENTLPAIRSAVAKGAAQIEFDLQLTKDARLVLMHDSSLERTTGVDGEVGDFTLAELKELDAGAWFGEEFVGTRIPTFEEVLEVIPREILCNCHLKGVAEIGAAAARTLREFDRFDHCFLAATLEQAESAQSVSAQVKICNMSRQTAAHTSYVDQTLERGCEFIQLLGSKENLRETVERLHAHGVRVNFFQGDTREDIEVLREAGVDFILTDNLDLCLEVLSRPYPAP